MSPSPRLSTSLSHRHSQWTTHKHSQWTTGRHSQQKSHGSLMTSEQWLQNPLLERLPLDKGWRWCIGCLKLHNFSIQRTTNYKALVQKMTYTDEASYGPPPPCTSHTSRAQEVPHVEFLEIQLDTALTMENNCWIDFWEDLPVDTSHTYRAHRNSSVVIWCAAPCIASLIAPTVYIYIYICIYMYVIYIYIYKHIHIYI